MEETKMIMQLQTAGNPGAYASKQNARFSNNYDRICTVKERWNETYNALPERQQELVDYALAQAKAEFKRRNPNVTNWKQLPLAEAKDVLMSSVNIDATMQRQLDIFWVLKLLNQFLATMVVPIQVYRPTKGKDTFLAWDGQHTLVLLWLIATQLFEQDPGNVIIPVNIYQSSLKAEMRANFITINGKEGKKPLEAIDIWEQMVFGVRVDGATNSLWIDTELKQQYIEQAGLFVTSKKFGNEDQPGAVSRLQEINKQTPEVVNQLCKYLAASTQLQRPVEEKEIVMMAHFFERCSYAKIDVTDKYISDLAVVAEALWNSDYSPSGPFWSQASSAYYNWHNEHGNPEVMPRFNKEPVHGFPFLIAQLKKSFAHPIPRSDSKSEFIPANKDLF